MIKIEVSLSEFDKKVLNHELLDVQEWMQNALDGKINSVKKRLIKEAQEKLFNDENIESIPATVSGSISLYFEQDYYKNAESKLSDIAEMPGPK